MTGDHAGIRLLSYEKRSVLYELNRSNGVYRRLPMERPSHSCGFAAEMTVGLRRSATLFVAIFADRRSLWLRLGGREFDLRARGIRLSTSSLFPFVRRFSVYTGHERVASHVLGPTLRSYRSEWTTAGDIFDFARDLSSSQDLAAVMARWNAMAAGEEDEPLVKKRPKR